MKCDEGQTREVTGSRDPERCVGGRDRGGRCRASYGPEARSDEATEMGGDGGQKREVIEVGNGR